MGAQDAPISLASKGTVYLPERQYKIIEILAKIGKCHVEVLAEKIGVEASALMRDLAELEAKGLIKVEKRKLTQVALTEEGAQYASSGLPERRLLELLLKEKEAKLSDLNKRASKGAINLTPQEIRIGLVHLARKKLCKIEKGVIRLIASEEEVEREISELRSLEERLQKLDGVVVEEISKEIAEFKRRKLIALKERSLIQVELTPRGSELYEKGLLKVAEVVTALTPELIISGKWREVVLKRYDLSVEVPTVYPARKHPYMELLDEVREILESMGFEEVKGPHVELELWNFDTLFQAQDHPAREIHDTFYLKYPTRGRVADKELLERVKLTHENGWITGSRGWRYKWSPEKALNLILRTQTTAVSMRVIYERKDGEYRCFSLDRVFRPETLDPTHSMEFYQLEGIIVGRKVTFKNLLWFFQELAKKLGLGKVKVKPAYFPFTEPSVEGFIKHPKLGWIEVFPGGMFRPEVLLPLGVKECNVAAWGIGIDRIAMTILEIDDIRDLFSQDISFLRRKKVPILPSLLR